jgi:carboxyl-terminal processing protease
VAADGRAVQPWVQTVAALAPAERRTATTSLLYRLNGLLTGAAGETLLLTLLDEAGREADHRVTLTPSAGQVVRFGNLPPALAFLEHDRLDLAGDGAPANDGACIGMIRLNMWMVPLAAAFDRAVDELRGCMGMVVDLRGNPGGVAGMVMGTAGHFLNDTLPLGYMIQRTSELRFKANPRRVRADGTAVLPFAGPLAVLTDEMTASTSEFFAGGLQGVGRARVFGTSTAGQALPAAMLRLPTDDVLMHVVANFTGPGGVRLEGRGVVPDVIVVPTRQALLDGRDPVLEAALDWISSNPVNGGNR